MNIFALRKKCLSSILLRDLEGFNMIIFEKIDKFLEYVYDGVPVQQNKVHV